MNHPSFDLETFRFFIDETIDSFTAVGSKIAHLETDPNPNALLNEIFRPVHSIKGNSSFFELNNLIRISHNTEDLLNDLRSGKIPIHREIIDLLLEGIDILIHTVNRVREDPNATDLTEQEKAYIDKIVQCRSRGVSAPDLIHVIRSLTGKLSELSQLEIDPNALPHASSVSESANLLIEDINGVLKEKNDEKHEASGPFALKGKDLTEEVHILLDVFNHLEARKDISSDLAKSFKLSFNKIYSDLDTSKKEKVHFETVEPLFEFLDDSFLNSSDDFIKQIGQAVRTVIESLEGTGSPLEPKKIGEILVEKGKISEQDLAEALKKQKPLGQILLENKEIQENELKDALNDQSSQIIEGLIRKEKPSRDVKTIRINQEKIDEFVFGVGGLIMNLDTLNFLQKELAEKYFEEKAVNGLKGLTATLNDLAYDLQNKIMEIRKVPARTVMQKLPALVRSLSQKLGKKIDVEILGDEVLVDKDIIEKIEDPLVHMIRNSVDHGIEASTENRVSKGKPEQGKIIIGLKVDKEFFYLDLMDDGQGIDPEKVKEAALRKGFEESELKMLSDQEAINLIFRSDFSCATTVSDLSGRGVGLDVVETNIQKLGGRVSVDSQMDRGTTFHIKIPLTRTLVTKEALFVEDQKEVFAVQSEEIELVTSLTTDQIMHHKEHIFAVIRDRVCPLRRLSDCFVWGDGSKRKTNIGNGNSRICGLIAKDQGAGILVENVLNFGKIVVKDLDQKCLGNTPGLKGYTIRGDGKVVMVLDLKQLLQTA